MSHKPNDTQQGRILTVLRAARDGTLKLPEEFIFRHPKGDAVSGRYSTGTWASTRRTPVSQS